MTDYLATKTTPTATYYASIVGTTVRISRKINEGGVTERISTYETGTNTPRGWLVEEARLMLEDAAL